MLFNLVLTSFRTMNSIEVACYLCLSSNIALLKTCLSHPPVITACVTRDVPDTCLYPGCMRAYRYKLPEAAAVVAPLPRQPQPQARTLSVINEDLTWTMTALAELRELLRVPASADAFENTGSAASLLLRAQSRRLGRRRRLVVEAEAAPAAAVPAAPAGAEAAPAGAAAAPAAAAAAPAAAAARGRKRNQNPGYSHCRYCAHPFWYEGALWSHETQRCPRRPRRSVGGELV